MRNPEELARLMTMYLKSREQMGMDIKISEYELGQFLGWFSIATALTDASLSQN